MASSETNYQNKVDDDVKRNPKSQVKLTIVNLNKPYFPINQAVPLTELAVRVINSEDGEKLFLKAVDKFGNIITEQNGINTVFQVSLDAKIVYGELIFFLNGKEIIDGMMYDFSIKKKIMIVDKLTESIPDIKIYRNEEEEKEALIYKPKDLMDINFFNSSNKKSLYVKMFDPSRLTRYHGISTGRNPTFRVRIQDTRIYGRWILNVIGNNIEEVGFEINYPFYVVGKREKINDNVLQEYKEKEVNVLMNEINEDCFDKIMRLAVDCVIEKRELADNSKESKEKVVEILSVTKSLLSGEEHHYNKKYDEAIMEFNKALIHTYYNLGTSNIELDNFAEASKYFERVLEIDPENKNANEILSNLSGTRKYLRQGINHFENKEFEPALNQFNFVLDEDEDNITALLYKARCLNKLRVYDDAEEILKRIIKNNPKNKEAEAELKEVSDARYLEIQEIGRYLSNANDYYNNKEYDKASKEYDKILDLNEHHIDTLYMKGLLMRDIDKYLEAIDYFAQVINLDSEHTEATKELNNTRIVHECTENASVSYKNSDFEECINYIESIVEIEPDNSNAIFLKIQALKKLARFDDALTTLENLRSIDSNYHELDKEEKEIRKLQFLEQSTSYYEDALEEYNKENYLSALNNINELLKVNPKHDKGLILKARILKTKGLYNDSKEITEKLIAANPDNKEAKNLLEEIQLIIDYMNRGKALAEKCEFEKAIEEFDKILYEESKNEDAIIAKGRALRYLARYDDAIKILDQLIIFNPENEIAGLEKDETLRINDAMLRSRVYLDNNDSASAIIEYDDILSFDPKNILVLMAKAHSLRQLGNYEESQTVLSKLLKYKKDHEDANKLFSENKIIIDNLKIANDSIELEEFEDVISVINKILEIDPNNEDALSLKLKVFKQQLKFDNAVDISERMKKINTENKKLHSVSIKLSNHYEKYTELNSTGDYQKMISIIDKMIVLESENKAINSLKDDLLTLAKIYSSANDKFEKSNYKTSLRDINKLLKKDKVNSKAIMLKVRILKELSRYKEAIKQLNDLQNINPSFPGIDDIRSDITRTLNEVEINKILKEAKVHRVNNEDERVIEQVNIVLTMDPESEEAIRMKIQALINLKRFSEAEEICEKLLQLFPDDNKGIKLLDEIREKGEEKIKEERIDRGDKLIEEENYDDAILLYEKVLEKDPDDVETLIKTGNAHKKMSRFDKAVEYFKRAISLRKNKELENELKVTEEEAKQQRINEYLEKAEETTGNHKKVLSHLDKILKLDPDNLEALYKKGILQKEMGKLEDSLKSFIKLHKIKLDFKDSKSVRKEIEDELIDEFMKTGNSEFTKSNYKNALKEYDKVLRINKKYIEAILQKGRAFTKRESFKYAHKSYDTIISIDKKHKEALYEKALLLMTEKKYEEAIKYFDRTIKAHPGFIDAEEGLAYAKKQRSKQCMNNGDMFFRKRQYQKAILAYDCTTKYNPKNKFAWNNRGLALKNISKIKDGIKSYRKAIDIDPKFKNAWNNLGIAQVDLKEPFRSLEYYNKALEIDPNYKQAWNNKGLAYHELKRYKEAIECFKKSVGIDSEYKNAWNNLGSSCGEIDDHKASMIAYNKAIELDNNYANALSGKGHLLIELKKYKDALEFVERALEIDVNSQSAIQGKARILVELKRDEEAIELFDKILETNSKYVNGWYYQGIAYNNLKKYKEAAICFEKAERLDPTNKNIRKSLKDVNKKL